MTSALANLCFDAQDPRPLAEFWAETLRWDVLDQSEDGVFSVLPTDGTRFVLDFVQVPEPKRGKNRIHLELMSESVDDQAAMVDRLIGLGAQRVDVGQAEEVGHDVLADPEGNEFCVGVRGEFQATTGLLSEVVFEPGNPVTGYFWAEALGWPVVYDEDGDTAVRAPDGQGPFITFGPPSDAAKSGKNRLHLDIAPPAGDDHQAEVERLESLGARRVDIGQGDVPWVVMADPDGNEFCVLTPRG